MPTCGKKCCPGSAASPSIKKQLFETVAPKTDTSRNKITVVGVGAVGMACAVSLLCQNVTDDLALIDCLADKLEGEKLDLQHGSQFVRNAKIDASTNYKVTAGSKICVVTAGVRQQEGESRLDLVKRNLEVFKHIIPLLMKQSPDTIILVVSNPCDILTYVAWKLSGLPKHKVLGSGTNLDTSRFRFLISQKLNIAPSSCHGYIIGEHGDSSVAVWSGVSISGVRLHDLNPQIGTDQDTEKWTEVHKNVINSAYDVIKLKGYTSWAIGLSVANICDAIMRNTHAILPVSVPVQGMHGIEQDVFLSLPTVLGQDGVCEIVKQQLSDSEKESLQNSAKLMHEVQSGLTF